MCVLLLFLLFALSPSDVKVRTHLYLQKPLPSPLFFSLFFLLLSSVFDGRETLNTRISCFVQGEKKRPLFFASIVDGFFFTSLSVPT